WCSERARQMRRVMLEYRDGARVFAGTHVANTELARTVELTLRTLQDAGFDLRDALAGLPVLFHYTVGFTLEEQARLAEDHPYRPEKLAERVDPQRFPLTAMTLPQRFDTNTDAAFEEGLRVIMAGLRAAYLNH
ncbi:MAG: TetR/AcrR family transcriptional regulator C-terminal domain-containing protein, partial [Candidatus Dormibacteraceae bacterium]